MMNSRWKWIAVWINVVCAPLIILHGLFPEFGIDSITIGLIVIMFLPWILPFIKELPTPWGATIKLDDIRAVQNEGETVGVFTDTALPLTTPVGEEPLWAAVTDRDANLGLAGLRMEIERKLVDIAELLPSDINRRRDRSRFGPGAIVKQLSYAEILTPNQANYLNELILVLNRAVHGAKVEPEAVRWAKETGLQTIRFLQTKLNELQRPQDGNNTDQQ